MKLAVFSDLHMDLDAAESAGSRQYDLGKILLQRLVYRLNRFVQPDVVVFAGDLLDRGELPDASVQYEVAREILEGLESPLVMIPGNHDGSSYDSVFGTKSALIRDIGNVRFVVFRDPELPYNAVRPHDHLSFMRQASRGHEGPLVSLQHVPIFPDGTTSCPYRYSNSAEILSVLRENRYSLALSGHYHEGFSITGQDSIRYHTVAAACESPFSFDVITIGNGGVESVEQLQLAVPRALGLVDTHVHSEYSYCGRGMIMERTEHLAPRFGLANFAFTEHSGQLLVTSDDYWSGRWFGPDRGAAFSRGTDRTGDFLRAAQQRSSLSGFELDVTSDGKIVESVGASEQVPVLLGSVHRLLGPGAPLPEVDVVDDKVSDIFLFLVRSLLEAGIHILAHPFRILSPLDGVEKLYRPVVSMLGEYGVAAEINFHTNTPPSEFFRMCIDEGVRVAFGSDAHDFRELGDFASHLDFLAGIGFTGNLDDVLCGVCTDTNI